MFRVSHHGGSGVVAGALSGLRGEEREGAAAAPFSKRFEEAVGNGVRERLGAASGTAVWGGGQYGAGD